VEPIAWVDPTSTRGGAMRSEAMEQLDVLVGSWRKDFDLIFDRA
jgi:hypothetical protein